MGALAAPSFLQVVLSAPVCTIEYQRNAGALPYFVERLEKVRVHLFDAARRIALGKLGRGKVFALVHSLFFVIILGKRDACVFVGDSGIYAVFNCFEYRGQGGKGEDFAGAGQNGWIDDAGRRYQEGGDQQADGDGRQENKNKVQFHLFHLISQFSPINRNTQIF